jgi:hypothetical protein
MIFNRRNVVVLGALALMTECGMGGRGGKVSSRVRRDPGRIGGGINQKEKPWQRKN